MTSPRSRNTRPGRRGSNTTQTGPVWPGRSSSSASATVTPTTGTPMPTASPCARARAPRRPVKLPGPTVTATASKPTPVSASSAAISDGKPTVAPRLSPPWCSPRHLSPSSSATEQHAPDASSASTRNGQSRDAGLVELSAGGERGNSPLSSPWREIDEEVGLPAARGEKTPRPRGPCRTPLIGPASRPTRAGCHDEVGAL